MIASTASLSRVVPSVRVLGFAVCCLVASMSVERLMAQSTSGFVGNWVEDQSKRQNVAQRPLTFRQGASGLEELRGPYANPVVQPVRFDGKPYPVEGANTIVWKQLDATRFERTIFLKEKLLGTRRLQVSADGSTLTEVIEDVSGPKKTTDTVLYRRGSGSGSSLAGEWKPQSVKSDSPRTQRVEAAGTGLRVVQDDTDVLTVTFDGKSSPMQGPTIVVGTETAAKIVNDRSIEFIFSRKGVPTGRGTWSLSQDGKTLTESFWNLGPNASKEPSVSVFTKQ